jgi:hypothetical protein
MANQTPMFRKLDGSLTANIHEARDSFTGDGPLAGWVESDGMVPFMLANQAPFQQAGITDLNFCNNGNRRSHHPLVQPAAGTAQAGASGRVR